MKKIIILFFIGLILFSSLTYAGIYEWVLGRPATINAQSEWVSGSPFIYINGTIPTGVVVDTTPPTYSDQKINESTYYVNGAYQINRTATDADNNVAWCNFSTNLTDGKTWVNWTNTSIGASSGVATINISTPSSWTSGEVFGTQVHCCDDQSPNNCAADTEFTYRLNTCVYNSSMDWNVLSTDNCTTV
jgi:hypothetical protein